ncbi:MAG: CDP-alcohol phosphatidyltransferase family protein [Robiginitomaculum sp.]
MSESADLKSEQYGRPLSIEEFSNRRIVHPLSDVIVRLALPLKLRANFVSVMGLGAGFVAGVLYYYQDSRLTVLLAFAFMFMWHVLDGADGRIARATGTSSSFGRILDGICDHLVFGAVYIAIVLYSIHHGGSNWGWLLGGLSAVSHALHSAGYEERRQKYQRRTRGQQRAKITDKLLVVGGKKNAMAGLYDWLQKLSTPRLSPLDDKLKLLRDSDVPDKDIQNIINKTVPIVRAWALLNANNRTIMIAVFALFAKPSLYFWYEILVLNIVFISVLFYEKTVEAKISQGIDTKLQVI